MEKELNDFKIEVLTQLAVINSKLDGYNKTQELATEADNRSKQNEQDIKTSAIGIIFLFIKTGMGVR